MTNLPYTTENSVRKFKENCRDESLRRRLLLHVCCGPCATEVIRRLGKKFKVTAYFYNPNIWPEKEYEKRQETFENFAKKINLDFIKPKGYDNEKWEKEIKGQEDEPEGGKRCAICYRMRLEEVAKMAKEKNFDIFAATLTISPHKKAEVINKIGAKLADKYGIKFLSEDFKKKDGFKHSVKLSKEFGMYRQSYCGCRYSINSKLKSQNTKP